MRRHDREVLGLANLLGILDRCEIVRIGLCAGDKPYIVPMNFAFETREDSVCLYLHCASEGKKLDLIAQNDNICFEADCSYRIVRGEMACGWSAEFQSVIGEGKIAVVEGDQQKAAALDLLMKRYGFVGTPSYNPQRLAAITVLRVSVSSITGKSNLKQP